MLARGRRRDDDDEEGEEAGAAEGIWRKQKYDEEARGRVTGSKEEMTGNDARRKTFTAGCTENARQLANREQAGERKRRTRDGTVGAATAAFKMHLTQL